MPKKDKNLERIFKEYKIDKMTEENFISFVIIFLHHFITPMIPIRGYLDLLIKGEIKETKKAYNIIIDKFERLADVCSEMANVAKLYHDNKYGEEKQEVIEINKKTSLKQLKIFMIEDDLFLCETYKKAFKEAGFCGKIFSNAFGVLEETIKEKPDIIITNIVMPGLNGLEFLTMLKENKKTKDIPVVILSTLGGKEEIKKGLELGAVDYLVKAKFTPGEVVERVKNYLRALK